MSAELLQIDVEMLLCRYGRSRVLAALADAMDITEKDLLQKVAALRSKREQGVKKKFAPQSLSKRVEAEMGDDTELVESLRPIAVAFDNGRVLPTLKSVHRFLASQGQSSLSIKSRKAAGPALLKAFRSMSPAELADLARVESRGEENDFALLSDAILNPAKRP